MLQKGELLRHLNFWDFALSENENILQWFYNSREIPQVEQFFNSVTILDFNYDCASAASIIHSNSMRSGSDIGVMDSLIAATAWVHDEYILTNDDHFNVINKLRMKKTKITE